jgi:hypothetical protein
VISTGPRRAWREGKPSSLLQGIRRETKKVLVMIS